MHGTVPAARATTAEAVPRCRQRTNLRQVSGPNYEFRSHILAARDVENGAMKRRSISFRGHTKDLQHRSVIGRQLTVVGRFELPA
jgi:hypothetical protein